MDTFTLLGGQLVMENTLPRPSEDPLWLAATFPSQPHGASVLDAACGSGVAALALARHQPHLTFSALDIDAALTALARRNALLNNITLSTFTADILTQPNLGPFNAILCNPPYHGQERGHQTLNIAKQQAHTLPTGHLSLWLEALLNLLTPTGTLHLILHTACEAELKYFLSHHPAACSLSLTLLQTSPHRPPKRLIATLVKGASGTVQHPTIQAFLPLERQKALATTIKKV